MFDAKGYNRWTTNSPGTCTEPQILRLLRLPSKMRRRRSDTTHVPKMNRSDTKPDFLGVSKIRRMG